MATLATTQQKAEQNYCVVDQEPDIARPEGFIKTTASRRIFEIFIRRIHDFTIFGICVRQ